MFWRRAYESIVYLCQVDISQIEFQLIVIIWYSGEMEYSTEFLMLRKKYLESQSKKETKMGVYLHILTVTTDK